tara:strand:+ start:33114 stop:33509 length:396 start_codon:yes stop_codon:yes gene_type:complete
MKFSKSLQRFAEKAGGSVDQTVRGVTLALFGAVIRDTPVDQGRLRGDWQTTVDQPATGQSGRVDKSGAQAMAEVVANTPEKAGQVTILTNNMPYCELIENGGSQKSPEGMMRKNVDRFERLLAAEAKKYRT